MRQPRGVAARPDGRGVRWLGKQPAERLDFSIDWTARLEGDAIAGSVFVVPPGIVADASSRRSSIRSPRPPVAPCTRPPGSGSARNRGRDVDRLEALVAIAHLRLRLVMVERNPHLLECDAMLQIKRPIELAGLKGRLARAKQTEAAIAHTGARYDAALDAIDEAHQAAKQHVGELRQTVEGMTGGTNAGPNDGASSSTASADGGQVITSKPETAA
jgi:hypothetical protein